MMLRQRAHLKSLKAAGNAVSMMIQAGLPIRQFLRTYDESHPPPHFVLDPNSTARFRGHRAQYKLGPSCQRYKEYCLAVSRENCCHSIQHIHSANNLNLSPPILFPKLLGPLRLVPYRTSKWSISVPGALLRDQCLYSSVYNQCKRTLELLQHDSLSSLPSALWFCTSKDANRQTYGWMIGNGFSALTQTEDPHAT